ncbi:hypothetical protein [Methyloceanibacter sp.]|uniref:hypothetical protein n=1 Tax=Methyloceanibacter sp. TaxID=1965321 RepID=UPI002D1FBC60|nr:hypothetical protein [Methyloceanibacter sp.]
MNDSIEACIKNGDRLLGDAMTLEFQEPQATRLMVSMIAQEEFAKAFLLVLVREGVVPWSPALLRAMNDHACKQLVAVLIEYLDPQWESLDEIRGIIAAEVALSGRFPPRVASAINILRYEKIGRWESNGWGWLDDPDYDRDVLAIAKGRRDKVKQDSVYVRIGQDGRVERTPFTTPQAVSDAEYEKAYQLQSFVERFAKDQSQSSIFYEKMRDALQLVFQE